MAGTAEFQKNLLHFKTSKQLVADAELHCGDFTSWAKTIRHKLSRLCQQQKHFLHFCMISERAKSHTAITSNYDVITTKKDEHLSAHDTLLHIPHLPGASFSFTLNLVVFRAASAAEHHFQLKCTR